MFLIYSNESIIYNIGLYDVFRFQIAGDTDNINIFQKLGIGLSAGGIAATLCNPVEVALVRMQADGSQKNIALKRNYKHIFDALIRVPKEEGFWALYNGVRPTVVRGMIVSCVQLGSYDQAKTMIRSGFNLNDGPALHLSSAGMQICIIFHNGSSYFHYKIHIL